MDTGREVWKAAAPVVPPPEDQGGGVTLIKQLTDVPALDSVLMTTFDHSITLAKTSSLNIWKQVISLALIFGLKIILVLPSI